MARLPHVIITCAFEEEFDRQLVPRGPVYFLDQRIPNAVARAGGLPLTLAPVDDPVVLDGWLDIADALFVTGGAGVVKLLTADSAKHGRRVRRQRLERRLIAGALDRGMPVLGACHGAMLINRVFGGTDAVCNDAHYQDLPADIPSHPIRLSAGSWLAHIVGETEILVNSFHSVGLARPGTGLQPAAHSPEGFVEAVEAEDDRFILGLQFHPELMPDALWSCRIFAALVAAARTYSEASRVTI